MKAVSDGAAVTSKTLTQLGHKKLGQIFDLASSVAGFVSSAIKADAVKNKQQNVIYYDYSWKMSDNNWQIYKFVRGTAEKVANIAGAKRAAGILNVFGFADDAGDIILGITEFRDPDVHSAYDDNKPPMWRGKAVTNWPDSTILSGYFRAQSDVTTINKLVGNVNSIFKRIATVNALAH